MRYLATTSDLGIARGYTRKLQRKWISSAGKTRRAKVFIVLSEAPEGGFGEHSVGEVLREPGIASLILLNKGSRAEKSSVPVLVRVSLDEYRELEDRALPEGVNYLVDLEGARTGWDFIWASTESRAYGTRFTNGTLPAVEGLGIGLFDAEGIEKGSGTGYKAVAWDVFDDAEVVPLEELNGVEEVAAPRVKAGKGQKLPKPNMSLFDDLDDEEAGSPAAKPKREAKPKTPSRAEKKLDFLDSLFS